MYQILLIGDPHFKTSNAIETNQLHQSTLKYLKSNPSIDFVVVLGDILHCHEKIHTQPFCRAVKFLSDLADERETFALIGNHDRINNNVFLTEEHPFVGLKEYPNLHIVDTTLYFSSSSLQKRKEEDEKLGEKEKKEKSFFVFVPYVPNGRFKEALEIGKEKKEEKIGNKREYEKCKAIFAHQEFRGCKMGAIISEDGDIWEEELPPVFSGHIHDQQRLQNNIFYPGIPFQHGFADSDDKGIYLLTIQDSSQKGETEWEVEKIELEITPKKLYTMTLDQFEKFNPPENTIIKINFECHESTMKKMISSEKFREKIRRHNIDYKLKVEKTKKIIKNHSSFLENLERRVSQSDTGVKEIYREISSNL